MAYRFEALPPIEDRFSAEAVVNAGKYYGVMAHAFYTLPENPHVLLDHWWTFHDLAPEFPKIAGFRQKWIDHHIDGTLIDVKYDKAPLFGDIVGRTYQIDLRDVSPALVNRANLQPRQKRLLTQVGATWSKGLVLLH